MYSIYRSILINSLVKSRFKINTQSTRLLMSDRDLGIYEYIEQRQFLSNQLGDHKDEFKKRTQENIDFPDRKVFNQDLKYFMAASDSNDDIDVAMKLTKKFGKQTSTQQSTVDGFTPGPILMRLLHLKRKPSQALDLFNNEDYRFLFMFYSSVSILMDLLYESGQYDDAIQVYHTYCDHLMKDTEKFFEKPKIPSIIAFACFAQMNTKESLEKAKELYENYRSVAGNPYRLIIFLAYLALRQQEFEFALETLSTLKTMHNSVRAKNIKILALLGLHRFGEALNLLYERSDNICVDVVEQIELSLNASGNDAYLKEFMDFKGTNKWFGNNKTLESVVFSAVFYYKRRNEYRNDLYNRSGGYSGDRNYDNRYTRHYGYGDYNSTGGYSGDRNYDNRYTRHYGYGDYNSRRGYSGDRNYDDRSYVSGGEGFDRDRSPNPQAQ